MSKDSVQIQLDGMQASLDMATMAVDRLRHKYEAAVALIGELVAGRAKVPSSCNVLYYCDECLLLAYPSECGEDCGSSERRGAWFHNDCGTEVEAVKL